MDATSELYTRIGSLPPHDLTALERWLADRERWRAGGLGDCFVIMPFSHTRKPRTKQYWTSFFEEFLRPSLEKVGYRVRRSVGTPANIVEGIMEDLAWSDLVLAVLTDLNPKIKQENG